jgi:hypothetical protein
LRPPASPSPNRIAPETSRLSFLFTAALSERGSCPIVQRPVVPTAVCRLVGMIMTDQI